MHWLILFFIGSVYASEIDPARDLYKNIRDIYHPTQKELLILQNNLLSISRPILDEMQETAYVPQEFLFIKNDQPCKYEKLVINTSDSSKECCIITYASFNERFSNGLHRLVDVISNSDYKGHLYYRVGGFPNIEGGDLTLAHVPFAFKVAFFKEMERLGYKKILWLDSSILPARDISLNQVFKIIGRMGLFVQANDHLLARYMNMNCAEAFGLSLEEAKAIGSCSAAIIGFDLTKPRIKKLLDAWHIAAHHPFGFFSDRSDQNALSILIHQFGFTENLIPRKLLGSLNENDQEGCFFLMDRSCVKDARN